MKILQFNFLRNILEFVFGKRITIKIYDAIKAGKKVICRARYVSILNRSIFAQVARDKTAVKRCDCFS